MRIRRLRLHVRAAVLGLILAAAVFPSTCWVAAYLDMRRRMLLQSFFMWPSSRVSRAFSRRSRSFSSPMSPPDAEPPPPPPGAEPDPDACRCSSPDPEFDDSTCSSEECAGEPARVTGSAIGIGAAATVTAPEATAAAAVAIPGDGGGGAAAAAATTFRRCISHNKRFSPRRKQSLANSHRSGTIFLNPYVLSWRTKLEKLLCLKYLGRRSRANSAGRHTTNVDPSSFHEITSSTAGSSTSWYVFVRNGVGSDLCPANASAAAVITAAGGGSPPPASASPAPCSAIRRGGGRI
ncbi:Os09g0526650 [Oryza sativa Japonica Group]|uniref:Os09g0526650 protein n=1 Tax=Oryza sativa subsp. japonica TaxID=39947 RepID=A0A0P0XPA3_ORYSJ|nr:hypothetical protein EE612_049061 [Oryza sativa]BAT09055.1 Os09g0526650 [Oryza sativa Japonica Group]